MEFIEYIFDKLHFYGVKYLKFKVKYIMPKIIPEKTDTVQYTEKASKDIDKLDNKYLLEKLRSWAKIVNNYGIREARKIKGYNDEALKGNRKGQRSIRLNRSYRAIYIESKSTITVTVIEVNNHEY